MSNYDANILSEIYNDARLLCLMMLQMIVVRLCFVLANLTFSNENNRCNISKYGGVDVLIRLLQMYNNEPSIVF